MKKGQSRKDFSKGTMLNGDPRLYDDQAYHLANKTEYKDIN